MHRRGLCQCKQWTSIYIIPIMKQGGYSTIVTVQVFGDLTRVNSWEYMHYSDVFMWIFLCIVTTVVAYLILLWRWSNVTDHWYTISYLHRSLFVYTRLYRVHGSVLIDWFILTQTSYYNHGSYSGLCLSYWNARSYCSQWVLLEIINYPQWIQFQKGWMGHISLACFPFSLFQPPGFQY